MQTIYEQLKKLCAKNNISILQLEKKMQVSNGSIGKWKTVIPRADILFRVSTFFGVSMEYFFNQTQVVNDIDIENNLNNSNYNNIISNSSHCIITISNGTTRSFELTEYEKELFRIYKALPIKSKSELISYACNLESSQKDGG